MYLSFFGLNEKPFAITPDPRYLYLSERHAEALAHLLYGVNEAGGFVQLTGEVGTGKTTIVRSLLAQTPKNADVALILNPRMTAPEFLLTICEELGVGVPDAAIGSIKDLVDILNRCLLRAHASNRRVVLVVDEAQNLSPDVLEQVRLLTNLETETQKLLQIILIGQPELRELLGRTELRQLAQRITGRYHLAPLSREETAAYVRHRLRVAGSTADTFTPASLREIHRHSGGVPRVINVICDRALLGAYTQEQHNVSPGVVRRAAEEVFGRSLSPPWLPWVATGAAAVLLAATGFGVWRYGLDRDGEAVASMSPVQAAQADEIATGAAQGRGSAAARVASSQARTAATGERAVGMPASAGAPLIPVAALLRDYARETDTDNAFNKLFALWDLRYVAGNADPCTQAARAGLECLSQRGSLAQLRLYNRPAILLLNDAAGASHQVVLTALDGERARVDLGGEHREIGVGDLASYWFGDFVLLWKRGPGRSQTLSVGMRGEDVRQLRENLERLNGVEPAGRTSSVYDAELARLVQDFQRRRRLVVDGIAGLQTRIMLDTALAAPDTPWLSPQPAGG
jgi:general secretion pathway protein A